MNYSRRQLEALGEPFGESATRVKLGGRIYGGGGSQPTDTKQTTVTELPEWAKPYAKDILSKGAALTDVNANPYQTYGGARVAGFSPLQTQAMTGAQNMQPSEQGQVGSALSAYSGLGGLNIAGQANPQGFQSQVGGYMNPYLQMSLAPQLAEANRQYDVGATKQQGAATQAGAFGGAREAIMAAENERNRNMALQNIVGQGYNQAFQNAQQQYNQSLGTQLQGLGLANTAAGQLGQLGSQQFQQGMDINKLQSGYGAMQQAQQQQGLDIAYQDFQNQRNYPYRQLGYMSDLLRGTPTGSSGVTNMYAPPPNVAGQIAGLGIGAMGLSKFMAEGGSVDDPRNIEAIVGKLSDAQLAQALKAAMQRGDAMEVEAIKQEQAMRASERNGLASTVTPDMADQMMPSAANGGIVAFAGEDESLVVDPMGGIATAGTPSSGDDRTVMEKLGIFNEKNRRALESADKPSVTKVPKTNAAYDAIESKIKATMGENAIPKKSPAFADSDAAERADRMTGTKSASKKSLGEALAVSQAAQNVSQIANVPQQSLEDRAMGIYKKFKEMSSAELKSLNDAIEGQKGEAEKIKAKGLSEALMQFGFGMAAKASEPGKPGERKRGLAGFIGSAAAASPILGQVASENEKLQRAAKDNYMKLKMDQTRYQVALDKGDMQAATSLAAQIRQGDMQQKQLDALIDYHNKQLALERQKMGITAAAYAPSSIREAQWLEANKDNPAAIAAFEKATRGRDAGATSADQRDRAALAARLEKLDAARQTELIMYPPNTAEGKKRELAYQAKRKDLHDLFGIQYGGAGGGGGTLNPDLFTVKPVK